MASQAEKNKEALLRQIDYIKSEVEGMSPECFEDYSIYLKWRPNVKEVRTKSIGFYSGQGAPLVDVPSFP